MKINPTSQLALRLDNYDFVSLMHRFINSENSQTIDTKVRINDDFIGLFMDEIFASNGKNKTKETLSNFDFSWVKKNTNFLITEPATKLAERIKIGDKFDLNFLTRIPDKKITFMIGQDAMIRYQKRGNEILMVRLDCFKDYANQTLTMNPLLLAFGS